MNRAETRPDELYRLMYRAMIARDIPELNQMLAEGFVLVHMTGLVQNREEFLRAVEKGTLRYFSAEHDRVTVHREDSTATVVGQSRVKAAVFGGGEHLWRLQQTLTLNKTENGWAIAKSVAGTY